MSYHYVTIANRHSERIETVAIFSLAWKLFINNSTPHVFINVISPHHSFYLKRCHFSSALRVRRKNSWFHTRYKKGRDSTKKRMHAHALWSRTKFPAIRYCPRALIECSLDKRLHPFLWEKMYGNSVGIRLVWIITWIQLDLSMDSVWFIEWAVIKVIIQVKRV